MRVERFNSRRWRRTKRPPPTRCAGSMLLFDNLLHRIDAYMRPLDETWAAAGGQSIRAREEIQHDQLRILQPQLRLPILVFLLQFLNPEGRLHHRRIGLPHDEWNVDHATRRPRRINIEDCRLLNLDPFDSAFSSRSFGLTGLNSP